MGQTLSAAALANDFAEALAGAAPGAGSGAEPVRYL